ncbi:MAG TPA: Hsp20/alpha crystallin family protein [Candidatus Faeciplasma gallinarum]|uniref:Hsp20/alpha crystallin family protein n=1 Tax=Candidatus Faeciplasma gallinarum TaxID=2840799 RepID=A0A9D1ENP1_9FIRM|nr:Hsp20/alpha crystallin family protein [Candidatus Faeciplasma gallinarum]
MLVPYVRRNNSLSAFDPFRELDELERAFFGNSNESKLAAFSTDIKDKGDHYELEADLPGVEKDDIKIDLTDNVLTISAERHSEYEENDKKHNYVRCERSYGSYQRSFDTTGIDTDHIEAEFKNGVLKLELPKIKETKPETKRLEIK